MATQMRAMRTQMVAEGHGGEKTGCAARLPEVQIAILGHEKKNQKPVSGLGLILGSGYVIYSANSSEVPNIWHDTHLAEL